MLPCFFQGFCNDLDFSNSNCSINLALVSLDKNKEDYYLIILNQQDFSYLGEIISSKYPLLAANNGVANLSLYSFLIASLSGCFLNMISTAPFAPMTAISAEGHATLENVSILYKIFSKEYANLLVITT